jgi:hypothetical protein
MEQDEYGRTPWLIETTVIEPSGIRVHVAVSIPIGQVWDDKAIGDATEVAQMHAAGAIKQINECRRIAADKVPF